ncbi:DUF6264 family protein [Agromyces sp. Soil535]|uniref:DUF6264 family protein n=1 Tax=Agromyces sp. Soil535 TaxID=1736390 RepID=UPI002100FF05|nr:DUF6264 family protein [Agromyces sp. Soil535]
MSVAARSCLDPCSIGCRAARIRPAARPGACTGEAHMSEAVGPVPVEASVPPRRPVILWDLVLTIVLLVVMVGVALVASFLSFFLAFAGDSCGSGITCDYDRIATGMLIAMVGPLVVGLLALIAAVVVLVLKRIAFWIPIVGIVLIAAVFIGGAALTASGVPGTTS